MKIKFLLQLKNNSKKILVMYNLNYYLFIIVLLQYKTCTNFFLAFKTHLFGKEKYFSHLMDYYNYGYE